MAFNPIIDIQEYTIKNPISMAGFESGVCYNSDIQDKEKNYKRGLFNIKNGHFRTLEFAQAFITIDNVSARVLRQLYTHIAGSPTRLQASTRYINYNNFESIIPSSVEKEPAALNKWNEVMTAIRDGIQYLECLKIPREDADMMLPLAMSSRMVFRTNARHLMDMSRVRMCARASEEYQILMNAIIDELNNYSEEWLELNEMIMGPRCHFGKCPESKNCPKKNCQK